VVFKPPGTHSVAIREKSGDTLVDWFMAREKADSGLADGGLMHRLDFETHGLVLFAKNIKSFEFFKDLQDKGEFIKEYSAVCENTIGGGQAGSLSGFPPAPVFAGGEASGAGFDAALEKPLIISSYFRPYGPGRKEVRPVTNDFKKRGDTATDRGGFYRTEIVNIDDRVFTLRIKRGFRHQIRCHLCWIGCPILGDSLYSKPRSSEPERTLALRARALFFTDPSGGGKREYKLDPFKTTDYADSRG
jgi:23S rRNA pseudouridine1911/1915/1917 synthase